MRQTIGALFVCIKGFEFDGHSYIDKAIADGAVALVVEELPESQVAEHVTLIKVPDTREALARISATWFGYPAKQLTMIGLTGTKGKTTTAHMIKEILETSGQKVGMIGTMGAYIGTLKIPTHNTTPESYELHALFKQMLDNGCSYVVMEVSSQGLKQKRTVGIQFHYSAFLNISPDHISPSEHKDFDEYLACKKMLFSQSECAVVNADAEYWKDITRQCRHIYTVSCKTDADFMAEQIDNLWMSGFLGVSFLAKGKLKEKLTAI